MIYLDLDSTLNNLIFVWVDWLNKRENKNYKVSDITHWNGLFDLYKNPLYFLKEDKYKSVGLFVGAKELINKLKRTDNVCILTNNYNFAIMSKVDWLCKYDLGVPVVFTNHDKTSYLKSDDIFVDDKLETILEAEKVCKNSLLYNHLDLYKYNIGDNKKTVYNFDELYDEVCKIRSVASQPKLF